MSSLLEPEKKTDWTPRRKVVAGVIGGAVSTLVIGYMARQGVTLSAEETGAVVTLCGAILGYFVPEVK